MNVTLEQVKENIIGLARCPICIHPVAITVWHEEVRFMKDPPQVVEKFVRHVRWQCLFNERDKGQFDLYVDNKFTPLGKENET